MSSASHWGRQGLHVVQVMCLAEPTSETLRGQLNTLPWRWHTNEEANRGLEATALRLLPRHSMADLVAAQQSLASLQAPMGHKVIGICCVLDLNEGLGSPLKPHFVADQVTMTMDNRSMKSAGGVAEPLT